MKLSIILPVYDENKTIKTVLEQVGDFAMANLEKEIIIIDGGSVDGTKEVLKEYEKKPGYKVIYEEKPRGKGAAVREGLKHITGDILLIQDADLEYSVSDYPKVLAPIINGKSEIVFGSRAMQNKQRWQYRKLKGANRIYGFFVNFGGFLFTGLFNILYGTSLTDGATMFKVFKTRLFKGFVLESDGFDFDWEIQGKFARKGYKFYEVPISYNARSVAEGKKIRFWRDGFKVFKAIIYFRFKRL